MSISNAQCAQELFGLQNQEFVLEMKLLDVVDERKRELIHARLMNLKEVLEIIEKNSTKTLQLIWNLREHILHDPKDI